MRKVSLGLVALAVFMMTGFSQAQTSKVGLGIRGGAGRIEGDVKGSKYRIRPFGSGLFYFSPDPHISLGLEAGYGEFIIDDDAQNDSLARAIPVEFDITFRYSPYHKITPFVTLGGGGIFWKNRLKGGGDLGGGDGSYERAYILKTAGGLDISLSRRLNLSLGAAFRYALTDVLDLDASGDEKDGLITFFSGFTFKFGGGKPDRDHDGVIDRYDLDSKAKEDRDGYMDHDGVPDTQINSSLLAFTNTSNSNGVDDIPPIVIHSPVLRATAGKDLSIDAEVFENRKLLKAAVLYRPVNVRRWLVEPMASYGNESYQARIPGSVIQKVGLEYCVVAVDEAISGIGYSGLPKRPNLVTVNGSETFWRVASVLLAASGWGTAFYAVSRNQKHP